MKIRKVKPNCYEFDYTVGGKRTRKTVRASKEVVKKLKRELEYLIGAEKLGITISKPLPPLSKAFKQYKEYQISKNLSKGTLAQDAQSWDVIKKCPTKDLTLFLSKQNYSVSTCNMRLRHAKAFFRWCIKQGWDYKYRYDLMKQRDSLESRFISDVDFTNIYSLLEDKYKYYIFILYKTGIRRSEFKRLKLEGDDTISVLGKNGLKRYIPVKQDVYKIIDTILTKIGFGGYAKALRNFSKCAREIGSKATPHWIRHTYALRMYFKTRDIHKVQLLLGHTSLKETVRYTKIPDNLMKKFIGDINVPTRGFEPLTYGLEVRCSKDKKQPKDKV